MTFHPPVLFVDFDGVLHSVHEPVVFANSCLQANPNLFRWLPLLEQALELYPEVRIIVSSSWRLLFDDVNLTLLLGLSGHRFIGVVECRKDSRADEIRSEVKRRGITEWLAIDDDPSVATASQRDKRFIPCGPSVGLSSPVVRAKLAQKLKQIHQRAVPNHSKDESAKKI